MFTRLLLALLFISTGLRASCPYPVCGQDCFDPESVWRQIGPEGTEPNRPVSIGVFQPAVGDFNGDDRPDVVYAQYGGETFNQGGVVYRSQNIYMHLGDGNSFNPTFDWSYTLVYPNNGFNEESVALSAGDLDGDGRDELVVGFAGANDHHGVVLIFKGQVSAPWLPGTAVELQEPTFAGAFGTGHQVSVVKDPFGDGQNGLLVGMNAAFSPRGAVALYRGSEAMGNLQPSWYQQGPIPINLANFGTLAKSVGDVNGDSYGDFVVTTQGVNAEGCSHVYLYFGGLGGPTTPPQSFCLHQGIENYRPISIAYGDVNGDSLSDFAISYPYLGNDQGMVSLFYGVATGVVADPICVSSPTDVNHGFGHGLTFADVNGDGHDDLIASKSDRDPNSATDYGHVFVFEGTAEGLNPCYSIEFGPQLYTACNSADLFGQQLIGVGDTNADGREEILVTTERYFCSSNNSNLGVIDLVRFDGDGCEAPCIPAEEALYRVNLGGGAYQEPGGGQLWSADQPYSAGQDYGYLSGQPGIYTDPIQNTVHDPLYQDFLYMYGDLVYRFNVPNGDYRITLKWQEPTRTGPQQRTFSVEADGGTGYQMLDGIVDLFQLAPGKNVAYDGQWDVEVSGGQLLLRLRSGADSAVLSAIEVRPIDCPGEEDPTPTPTPTCVPVSTANYRVNVGGGAYQGTGDPWSADQAYSAVQGYGYLSGQMGVFNDPIQETTDDPLYQDFLYIYGDLVYRFDLPAGDYRVTFKWQEPTRNGASQRVFSVEADGGTGYQLLAGAVDLFHNAPGKNVAYDLSWDVAVSAGQLLVRLHAIADSVVLSAIEVRALDCSGEPPAPTVLAEYPLEGSLTNTAGVCALEQTGTVGFVGSPLPPQGLQAAGPFNDTNHLRGGACLVSAMQGQTEWGVTGYVYANSFGGDPAIVEFWVSSSEVYWMQFLGNGVLRIGRGSEIKDSTTGPASAETWYHFSLRGNGTELSASLSPAGAPDLTADVTLAGPSPLPSNLAAIHLGRLALAPGRTLHGYLDHVSFWTGGIPASAAAAAQASASRLGSPKEPPRGWLRPEQRLLAAPNPAKDAIWLVWRQEAAGLARITAFNLAGDRVRQWRFEDRHSGEHREEGHLAGLAPGLYILVLEAPGPDGPAPPARFKLAVVP